MIHQNPVAADEGAETAQGLAQRAHEEVGPRALQRRQPRAFGSEKAAGVGLVRHQQRVVLRAERGEPRQIRGVAIHAEDRIGDDEGEASRIRDPPRGHLRVQVTEVQVPIDLHDRALRLRQAAAIHERRVVQRVGEDRIPRAGERGQERGVGLEPGVEEQRGLRALPLRQLGLEQIVKGRAAPQQARRARARAVGSRGVGRGVGEAGVFPQAQVVVGAEVQALGRGDGPGAGQVAPRGVQGGEAVGPGLGEGRGGQGTFLGAAAGGSGGGW